MAQQQQQQHQHQHQHQQLLSGMWPWSGHRPEDTDDSWEVRTFSTEDTKSYLTTWPPRSYTCSFCRREFRSAQALGGHMNVHRRDRAKLHQSPVVSNPSPPPLVISNAGMSLFYPLPVPSTAAVFAPAPSTVLSMSPCSTTGTDPVVSLNESPGKSDSSASSTSTEELDLELRLGW
ncbi:hypothetical protein J5N97_018779 [Dioscorea zingiberensis]|uniref:C2H2-type domain-containing protein n=1 Tax=Dioscorea zingiberensis TaxID=325984 RepID=A0A9D5CDI9_9LILI|nr:hypothetical protein J5N97_018779 [Dioscorea zingiberensis]